MQARQLDAQLGALDQLTRTLSLTASRLAEEPEVEELVRRDSAPAGTGPPRRIFSDAHWRKLEELAAQVERAKQELAQLDDESDDEDVWQKLLDG